MEKLAVKKLLGKIENTDIEKAPEGIPRHLTASPTPKISPRPSGGIFFLPHHGGDLAQQRGLAAVDGPVVLVLRQQPHLAVPAAQPLHRGLVPPAAPPRSRRLCAVGWRCTTTRSSGRMPAFSMDSPRTRRAKVLPLASAGVEGRDGHSMHSSANMGLPATAHHGDAVRRRCRLLLLARRQAFPPCMGCASVQGPALPALGRTPSSSMCFRWKCTVDGDFSPTASPISRTGGDTLLPQCLGDVVVDLLLHSGHLRHSHAPFTRPMSAQVRFCMCAASAVLPALLYHTLSRIATFVLFLFAVFSEAAAKMTVK